MQDVLKEAEQYNNQVLVAHESDDFQVVERWEPVTEVDVQTPLDVYRELAGLPLSIPVCTCWVVRELPCMQDPDLPCCAG